MVLNQRPWATLLLLVSSLLLTACDNRRTFTDKFDAAEMQQAISQAQAGWDAFVARALNPQPGDEGFNVKVKLTDANGTEHLWLSEVKLDTEPYVGTVVLDAEILKNVKSGQFCTFTRADVSDWMYRHKGKVEGNHSLRVILKTLPKEHADELKAKAGWD